MDGAPHIGTVHYCIDTVSSSPKLIQWLIEVRTETEYVCSYCRVGDPHDLFEHRVKKLEQRQQASDDSRESSTENIPG